MNDINTLSDRILFGQLAEVKAILEAEPALVNEPDPYGYTPLIESVIVDKMDCLQYLLQSGADVNGEDVLGQTALHWAVAEAKLPLIQMLLASGADPNHLSAEAEPILAKPLLRKQTEIVTLLLEKGADKQVAEDYLQTKLMGHRYELQGEVDIVNHRGAFLEMDYEGFVLEFTLDLLRQSLAHFVETVASKHYPNYSHILSRVLTSLRISSELSHFSIARDKARQAEAIQQHLQDSLLLIPVSYEGHAITLLRYRHYLAHCDRGVVPRADTVIIYEMRYPERLDAKCIQRLWYERGKNKAFIQKELKAYLGLTPVISLPTRYQVAGNCSWANVEAAIPSMMLLLMAGHQLKKRHTFEQVRPWVMRFYQAWTEWDKDMALLQRLLAYQTANLPRRAAMVDLFGAIFAQRCDPLKPRELRRAKLILPILLEKDTRYVLDAYLRQFSHQNRGDLGQRFWRLLQACGVRLND